MAPLAIAVCTEAQDTPRQAQISPPAIRRFAAVQQDAPLARLSSWASAMNGVRRSRAASSCALPMRMTASSRPSLMTGAQAFLAIRAPTFNEGPGLAVRIAADRARRATAKGCSPASR